MNDRAAVFPSMAPTHKRNEGAAQAVGGDAVLHRLAGSLQNSMQGTLRTRRASRRDFRTTILRSVHRPVQALERLGAVEDEIRTLGA